MWQVVCDKCLHTETVGTADLDEHECAACGCGELLGPFVTTPGRFDRTVEWELLTSPLYRHGGAIAHEP